MEQINPVPGPSQDDFNSLAEQMTNIDSAKLDKMASPVDVPYGESGKTINIDNINSQSYMIRFTSGGASFSGTAPTGISGNGFMLIGFSIQSYGCQLAFGFGNNKIAIRNKPYGGSWANWVYLQGS